MNLGKNTEAKETASAKVLRYKFLIPEGQPRRPAWLEWSEETGVYKRRRRDSQRTEQVGSHRPGVEFGFYLECGEKSRNKKPLESFEQRSGRVRRMFLRTSFWLLCGEWTV